VGGGFVLGFSAMVDSLVPMSPPKDPGCEYRPTWFLLILERAPQVLAYVVRDEEVCFGIAPTRFAALFVVSRGPFCFLGAASRRAILVVSSTLDGRLCPRRSGAAFSQFLHELVLLGPGTPSRIGRSASANCSSFFFTSRPFPAPPDVRPR